MKLVLYSSSGTPLFKKQLIFKLPKGTRAADFFRKENVEQSPWDDLMTTGTPAAFVPKSRLCPRPDHCRLFEAMKTLKGDKGKNCDGDSGWLMLTSPDSNNCPYEKKRGRQRVFLYSKRKDAAKFSDDSESSKCLSNTFSFFLFLWTR